MILHTSPYTRFNSKNVSVAFLPTKKNLIFIPYEFRDTVFNREQSNSTICVAFVYYRRRLTKFVTENWTRRYYYLTKHQIPPTVVGYNIIKMKSVRLFIVQTACVYTHRYVRFMKYVCISFVFFSLVVKRGNFPRAWAVKNARSNAINIIRLTRVKRNIIITIMVPIRCHRCPTTVHTHYNKNI